MRGLSWRDKILIAIIEVVLCKYYIIYTNHDNNDIFICQEPVLILWIIISNMTRDVGIFRRIPDWPIIAAAIVWFQGKDSS
jgi:hypothetical protein